MKKKNQAIHGKILIIFPGIHLPGYRRYGFILKVETFDNTPYWFRRTCNHDLAIRKRQVDVIFPSEMDDLVLKRKIIG